MPRSLVALGANLGDRSRTLDRAVELLAARADVWGLKLSRYHETRPVGGPAGQPAFLNAAAAFETRLSAEELHAVLRQLETDLGRRPAERWGARTIDLDLLLYGDAVIGTAGLAVPHPRMAFRRFVLAPAAEVASGWVHPLIGWSIARLLAHLDAAPPYVALLAPPAAGRGRLAASVARAVGGTHISAAGFAGDSSGPAPASPIQFLDRAARVLAGVEWSAPGGAIVSDFYFDECLAYARTQLDDADYQQVRRAWEAVRQSVVAPKLLVVLDSWEAALAAREPAVAGATNLRRELLALAGRPDVGPVLFVQGDLQTQHDEIVAAIEAMC